MRVTFFHYAFKTAAPLVQINEFARAFRSLGHELCVHAMDVEPEPSLRHKLREKLKRRVGQYLHEANALRKNLSYYRRECRIVQDEQPDLVLARYKLYHGSAVLVGRRFHLPVVIWVDAPAAYEQRTYLREFVQLPGLAERLEGAIIRLADQAIVVSGEAKRYLPPSALRNGHLEVVPNGVDPGQFSPTGDGSRFQTRFPVENPVVLGFVGSFAPWHGIESLKTLIANALRLYDNTCVLLVGDGPRRAELEAFVQSGGWDPRRVRFTGQVAHAQVPAYVAAMDICLLPYDQGSDGFYFSPMKLFEYMACGKPVLAAKVGQVDQVIDDGRNGLISPSGDEAQMTAKLTHLIDHSDLRQRLGEAARRTILERYTWQHTARAMEQVFTQALAARRVFR